MGEQHENFVPTNEGVFNALDYLRKTCRHYTARFGNQRGCEQCPLRGKYRGECMFESLYDPESRNWDGRVEDWPLVPVDTTYAALNTAEL